MSSQVWLIEPRDPFFARDGRPFGADPGSRATSLPFPYPSTLAGAIRTVSGLNAQGVFSVPASDLPALKRLEVLGPLLVELDQQGSVRQWLAPAPADALLELPAALPCDARAPDKRPLLLHWQRPLKTYQGAETDLDPDCGLVGTPERLSGKPAKGPAWWRQDRFEQWLEAPEKEDRTAYERERIGSTGPTYELRTHVSLDPASATAAEGMLYQTRSLEFQRRVHETRHSLETLRLALAVSAPSTLRPRLHPVGGERRLSAWRLATTGGVPWMLPSCPVGLKARILEQHSCRVILLTPAIFKAGWRPEWLLEERNGCTPELVGAAVERTQVVSGWDFARPNGGGPKVARRMVPSGSVYYLRLRGGTDAVARWMADTWMRCMSDDEQDRLDGFGLAVLGAWSGKEEQQR